MKNLIWLLIMVFFLVTPAYSAGEAENQRQSELVKSLGNDQPAKAKEIPLLFIFGSGKKKIKKGTREKEGAYSRVYVAKSKLKNKELPPEALDILGDKK